MKTAPLFRGKRTDNGEMVTGDFSHLDNDFMIGVIESVLFEAETNCHQNEFVWHEVDPSTVEQIAGDVVEENTRLRDELDRLKDVVCEEDVYSIEEALREKK